MVPLLAGVEVSARWRKLGVVNRAGLLLMIGVVALAADQGSAAKPGGEEGVGHDEGPPAVGDELGVFEDVQGLLDRGGIG